MFSDSESEIFPIMQKSVNPRKRYMRVISPEEEATSMESLEKENNIAEGKTQSLEKSTSKRTINTDQNEVNWLKIQWMQFYHDIPYKMFYKLTLDEQEEFQTLDLSLKRGRPRRYSQIEMVPLYADARPITAAKYKDMMDLLNYIPPIYHSYLKNLKHLRQNTISEDLITPINDDD